MTSAKPKLIKLVAFVPATHADIVRQAMGDAGAGVMGDYSHATFSHRGFGRCVPLEGSNSDYGQIGQMQIVEEERIETLCPMDKVKEVTAAIRKVHPYELVVFDLIPVLDEEELP